ncbi:MAG: pterin-4-alpha-carbinolamine dehydratase [Rhodospirillaceae bacterium]|nr:pterin-4-alpha-carbinolamine dehydratase [Rhodospirillaceae bacterium]|tara:strand:+ start:2055 stop:2396 length:342 start_codon:yes stop_codon:yes gene_type:complete
MSFSEKTCQPCRGGIPPLDESASKLLLEHTPDWILCDNNTKLNRKFEFTNFVNALNFVNIVSEIAEEEGHHPDISFGWGYCIIELYTHKIKGLHENDFIMASKISKLSELNTT